MRDFERMTLLEKCQALLGVLRPKTCRRIVPKYNFSMQQLERLDLLRHDMVHRTKFAATKGRLSNQHDYFLKTATFFITLIEQKYGFRPSISEKDVESIMSAANEKALERIKTSGQTSVAS